MNLADRAAAVLKLKAVEQRAKDTLWIRYGMIRW